MRFKRDWCSGRSNGLYVTPATSKRLTLVQPC
jgi:hypothetical protein